METLEARRETLCLNFALKCVKNTRMKEMFPLNDKKHAMEKRESEKYKIQHVTTARQRLLNKFEETKQNM